MMKTKITLILLLVQSIFLFGQKNIVVQVMDARTQTPLVFANIFFEKSNVGDATDLNGVASFPLKSLLDEKDILECTYIGFENQGLEVFFKNRDTIKITLKPKLVALEEVVVIGKSQKLTGKEVIIESIKRIKENYLSTPSNLKAFYREKLLENDKCIEVNEALCTFYYTKYPQKHYNKKSFRKFYRDRDPFDRILRNNKKDTLLFIGNPQFFKYYNTEKDECYIQTKGISDNHSTYNLRSLFYSGPLALTAIDKVKYLADFLDNKLLNKYAYSRKGATYVNGELCLMIGFQPTGLLKNVFQEWNKKVSFPIYSGTIYVSTENFAIVKFECQLSSIARLNSYKVNSGWQIFPTSLNVEVNYSKNKAGKWYLSTVKSEQFLKKNSSLQFPVLEDYRCLRSLNIYESSTEKIKIFNKEDPHLLKDKLNDELRIFPIEYDEEVWTIFKNDGHYISLTEKELAELESKTNLLEQFKRNSEQ